ncbi:5,10-methylenetetrahydrofolate reductase [Amycolatopsis sp. K13G38]|uniref:Methylenetetrahydrofolate reductase n=1 Tax=Amycolatopsis acididurans TaxID=2724524 RepID=A0ABX1IZE4_9PSEU|nr:methylenetetrahydrofolate reductase [Amycolatopsis acididurans]NKQ51412.1 5,10-methylenetetrahydrofolate reductase [Amycolatopsis acididurans]
MTIQQEVAGHGRRRSRLAGLVHDMSYEVMPFKNTERDVLAHVPTTVPLTVTVTEAKGIDTTLNLTERLLGHGYRVAPHLPARLFTGEAHVRDVIARLRDGGVRSVFVIGGDAPEPAGPYPDAFSLLQAIAATGHQFDDVGIGGYPEGHPKIPQDALDLALKQKAPLATHVITQICFDATTTARWAAGIASAGIDLPIRIGMPGPVNRQKLMRISAGIGLGQSARFLRKQQNLLWRFLLPGGYRPTKLAERLGAKAPQAVAGLHIFTFNELRGTERWRQDMLALVSEKDER